MLLFMYHRICLLGRRGWVGGRLVEEKIEKSKLHNIFKREKIGELTNCLTNFKQLII